MDNSLYFFILNLLNYLNNDFKDVLIEEQGIVRGYKSDADDVFSFYGIPYATTPSGDDKFKVSFKDNATYMYFNSGRNIDNAFALLC